MRNRVSVWILAALGCLVVGLMLTAIPAAAQTCPSGPCMVRDVRTEIAVPVEVRVLVRSPDQVQTKTPAMRPPDQVGAATKADRGPLRAAGKLVGRTIRGTLRRAGCAGRAICAVPLRLVRRC